MRNYFCFTLCFWLFLGIACTDTSENEWFVEYSSEENHAISLRVVNDGVLFDFGNRLDKASLSGEWISSFDLENPIVCFGANDQRIFWMDNQGRVMRADHDGSAKTELQVERETELRVPYDIHVNAQGAAWVEDFVENSQWKPVLMIADNESEELTEIELTFEPVPPHEFAALSPTPRVQQLIRTEETTYLLVESFSDSEYTAVYELDEQSGQAQMLHEYQGESGQAYEKISQIVLGSSGLYLVLEHYQWASIAPDSTRLFRPGENSAEVTIDEKVSSKIIHDNSKLFHDNSKLFWIGGQVKMVSEDDLSDISTLTNWNKSSIFAIGLLEDKLLFSTHKGVISIKY